MDLKLDWHKPLPLTVSTAGKSWRYKVDFERVPAAPGVYIFMRKFGKRWEPLYIGKAIILKERIKQQLNAMELMNGIKNKRSGSRVLFIGEFKTSSLTKAKKCVTLIESALIRHFLSEGHDLLNKAGTRLANHSLKSEGVTGRFLPQTILFK